MTADPAHRPFVFRHAKLIVGAVLAVACIALAGLFAAGWYYSGVLDREAFALTHDREEFDLLVVAIDRDAITLRASPGTDADGTWQRNGVYGLHSADAYGRVGEVRSRDGREVVRAFEPVSGSLAPGAAVRIDAASFPGDPREGLGLDFEEVVVPGPLGPLPAWKTGGEGETWAILVHGHRSNRRAMLRQLGPVAAAGLPALVISYRNDVGVAADPSGRHQYGATEWEDLDAAVTYAREHGARRLVLVGVSMGGGIVASFLQRSPSAGLVAAVVLDSPMLDFEAAVEHQAAGQGAPRIVTAVGKRIASWRFDVDWDELDYLQDPGWLEVPALVFHSVADDDIPIATSERLARAKPELVTLVPIASPGHVLSWNADPAAYEAQVASFLEHTGVATR